MACDTQLGEHTHNPNAFVGAGAANAPGRGLNVDQQERDTFTQVNFILEQRQARRSSKAKSRGKQATKQFQKDPSKDGRDPCDRDYRARARAKGEMMIFQNGLKMGEEPGSNQQDDGKDQQQGNRAQVTLEQLAEMLKEQPKDGSEEQQQSGGGNKPLPNFIPEGTLIKTKATLVIEQELTFPDGTTKTQSETFVSEGEDLR